MHVREKERDCIICSDSYESYRTDAFAWSMCIYAGHLDLDSVAHRSTVEGHVPIPVRGGHCSTAGRCSRRSNVLHAGSIGMESLVDNLGEMQHRI